MGKAKETVLQVIRSASRDETGTPLTGELITSFLRGVDNVSINFKCSINAHAESLLEEETNEADVISLRFRYLTTPPPTLPIYRYEKVTTVRVSCVVPVPWLFGVFVQMLSLETVSFGTGCFEDERCDWPAQYKIKLEQCTHVKELKIEVNILKFQSMDEESQRTVKNRIYAIFDNATTSFPQLIKVDFCLPLDVDLTSFLNHFQALKATAYSTMDNACRKLTYKSISLQPHAMKSEPQHASNLPPFSSTAAGKKTATAEAAGSNNFYAQTPRVRVPEPPVGPATARLRNRKKVSVFPDSLTPSVEEVLPTSGQEHNSNGLVPICRPASSQQALRRPAARNKGKKKPKKRSFQPLPVLKKISLVRCSAELLSTRSSKGQITSWRGRGKRATYGLEPKFDSREEFCKANTARSQLPGATKFHKPSWTCHFCQKEFNQSSNFFAHSNGHVLTSGHFCKKCRRYLVRISDLRMHEVRCSASN